MMATDGEGEDPIRGRYQRRRMDSKRRTPTEWLDPKEQPKHISKERFTSTGDGLGEIRRIPKDIAGLSQRDLPRQAKD